MLSKHNTAARSLAVSPLATLSLATVAEAQMYAQGQGPGPGGGGMMGESWGWGMGWRNGWIRRDRRDCARSGRPLFAARAHSVAAARESSLRVPRRPIKVR